MASLVAQSVKNLPASAGDMGSIPGSGRSPWSRKWQPIPVFLPGKFHEQRSMVGCSPWGHKDLGTTGTHGTETLKWKYTTEVDL